MTNTEPVAWVMPGDCNEDVNGFLPARINREGEFTKPLYPEYALQAERERAEKAEAELAAIKEALQKIRNGLHSGRYSNNDLIVEIEDMLVVTHLLKE